MALLSKADMSHAEPVDRLTQAVELLNEIDDLVLASEKETKPLELPPYREQLFALFARAWKLGLISEEGELDLTADGLTKALAGRWGLASAAQDSYVQQAKLSPDQVQRMRLLWSCLRLWMEWTYAWQRWNDFHTPLGPQEPQHAHDHDCERDHPGHDHSPSSLN